MERLILLQKKDYVTLPETDPLIYYYLPVLGPLYRRRVEIALDQCRGGERVLEVGYGSGVTFPNLAKKYGEIYGVDLYADAETVARMWAQQNIHPKLQAGNLLHLPYPNGLFDTVLLISILEHIKPEEQAPAMAEVHRVLKPGGQMVYGVPIERPLMMFVYRVMGYNIREHHFSTEKDVAKATRVRFQEKSLVTMRSAIPFMGAIYQVGHFTKAAPNQT